MTSKKYELSVPLRWSRLQVQASTKFFAFTSVPSENMKPFLSFTVKFWLSVDSIDSAMSISGAAVSAL